MASSFVTYADIKQFKMGVWPDLNIYSFYYRYWRSLTANISLPVRTLAISIRVLYSTQLVTAETWQTGALTPLGLPGNGGEGEGAGQQGDVQEGGGHLAGSHITWAVRATLTAAGTLSVGTSTVNLLPAARVFGATKSPGQVSFN